MKRFLMILIFFTYSLYADSQFQWFYSKDNKEWFPTEIPYNLSELPNDKDTDVYFLKYRFELNDNFPSPPIALRAGIILDRDRVWLNGQAIGSTGIWDSNQPQGYDKIRIYDLPDKYLKKNETNEILFQIKRYFPDEIGIAQDRFEIGPSKKIWRDFYLDELSRIGFLIVYITVSFYFAFLFIRKNSEKEYLFFSLFTLNLVIYQFLRSQSKFMLPLEFWEIKKLEYIVLPSFIPLMAHFLRYFLKHKYNYSMKTLDAMSIFAFVLVVFQNDVLELDKINRLMVQPIWIGYVLHESYYIYKEIKNRNIDAILIGIGIASIVGSAIVDILSARYVWNIPRVSGYLFIANVIFQAFLLANRFVRLTKEVEDLNQNLENKVEQRTRDLEESLEEIKKLKVQQDGDYFLTSLLLKPLHSNTSVHENITIEGLTIQKKQFEFKKKNHEIGGDLSFIEKIELNGEEYFLFINSDAMGKSIQGAGGALVLGVLLRSILARQSALSYRSKYPEKWLKDSFLDIQKAFETFDGSMYVSLIMGLVHKKTGFIYYYNAEHPGMVLYRNKKADFLENNPNEIFIRKIGIPGNEEQFYISTFQMKQNDILFLGTDGRDDILINQSETQKSMNEDERIFINCIEESDGDLRKTLESIQNKGEITDDISLMRIQYSGNQPSTNPKTRKYLDLVKLAKNQTKEGNLLSAIHNMEKAFFLSPDYGQVAHILGKLYFKIGSYQQANEYFQKALKNDPGMEESILWSAICFKKMCLIRQAIDTAERLRLRNPKHSKAIDFLEKIYRTNYILANSSFTQEDRKAA